MIEISRPKDVDFVTIADIHIAAFPDFFLTKFGRVVLGSYYADLFKFEESVFRVVKDNNDVVGFVCGCADPAAFNKTFIRRRCFSIGIATMVSIVKHPGFLKRLLTRPADISHFPNRTGILTLLSIAVDPAHAKRGLGKMLISEFIIAAKKLKRLSVYLTTDQVGNDAVNSFYIANGFSLIGNYDSGNHRIMNEYKFDIE